MGAAQLLLGLGVPISISPDDPGKFGLEDSTMDIYVTFVSSNWDLRHLKLTALHSINHAITSEEHRKELHSAFNKKWDEWVHNFIGV
jgi:adenosine deaminase